LCSNKNIIKERSAAVIANIWCAQFGVTDGGGRLVMMRTDTLEVVEDANEWKDWCSSTLTEEEWYRSALSMREERNHTCIPASWG
jgi:hypothetical protein